MINKLGEALSKALHERFPHAKAIVASINDSIIVINAFNAQSPAIPEEINELLRQVGIKFNLRTGDLAWVRSGDNLEVYLVPDVTGYSITVGHWSTDLRDKHTENDADSTYAVVDNNGRMVDLFNTKEEAEYFTKHGRRITSNAVNLSGGFVTIGAGTVPTSLASTSRTRIEDLSKALGAASFDNYHKRAK